MIRGSALVVGDVSATGRGSERMGVGAGEGAGNCTLGEAGEAEPANASTSALVSDGVPGLGAANVSASSSPKSKLNFGGDSSAPVSIFAERPWRSASEIAIGGEPV